MKIQSAIWFLVAGFIGSFSCVLNAAEVCENIFSQSKKFTIYDAKTAAVHEFRANPSYRIGPEVRVEFQKRNSEEETATSLLQQMNLMGPQNRDYATSARLLKELQDDSSLQIFSIWLTTGQGDARTQNIFLVRLHTVNAETKSEVSDYFED